MDTSANVHLRLLYGVDHIELCYFWPYIRSFLPKSLSNPHSIITIDEKLILVLVVKFLPRS